MATTENLYVQYHNADKLGYFPTENIDFDSLVSDLTLDDTEKTKEPWIYTTKKTISKAKGSRCFLIVGKTENKIKNYYLWYSFKIESIEEAAADLIAIGTGKNLKHPVLLNNLEDFESFKKFCGNFGIGFQKIDKHKFSETLQSYINETTVNDTFSDRKIFLENEIQKFNDKMLLIEPERRIQTINKLIRKDSKIVKLLKEYVDYKCQFPDCHSVIPDKKRKVNYVEVAHIKAVAEGGKSIIGNLVVLCPNHHKEFDLGERNIFNVINNQISGILNDKNLQINLINNYSYKINDKSNEI
ncbi:MULTISPECIES: hypothetical protein [Chryseobacterium]|uniref:HNH nuclease domain-containing protein n=1 Tax=Chryseobacterium endophyticum TaxID=1854762 RepID=A0AAU6WVH6_9FLAO|nr:hypothetical protein [uncultured Chryseobacterium sp.]